MGQISYTQFQQTQQKTNGSRYNPENAGRPRIGFFSLKNDKDQAVVRLMVDSTDDFDIVSGHRMTIGGFSRMVGCLRDDAKEPMDNCPLCAAGKRLETKFYIHLIQYVRDDEGKIVAQPKVWERSTAYMGTLSNLINEYGPLSDNIFKITRNGAKGDTSTSYDITYCKPDIYKPEIYPKDETLFKDYKALGGVVFNYDAAKMVELLEDKTEDSAPTQPTTPTYQAPVQPAYQAAPQPARTFTQPTTEEAPARPRRFY